MQDTRFGFILLENPFMRSEDIERCLQIQALGGHKKPIGQILLEQGVIGEHMLKQVLAIQEHRRRRLGKESEQQPLPDSGGLPSLDELIERAALHGASDLLLRIGRRPVARFAGRVEAISARALDEEWMGEVLARIGGNEELARFLRRQCFVTSYRSERSGRPCRVQLFAEGMGAALSLRLLPHPIPSLEELGHSPLVASLAEHERGLLLIAGPAAAGKSTTALSLLELLGRRRTRHLLSLTNTQEPEPDVAESLHTQRVIGRDCDTLVAALHDAFREDVDVIVVDELRSDAPIPLLLQAATTHALVIATMRASSASDALARLFDNFGGAADQGAAQARASFAAALRGLVYQELLPAAGRNASLLASEVLTPSTEIQKAIGEGALDRLPILAALGHGTTCLSFDEALIDLAESGQIENDEAFVRARDKQRLLHAAMGA